MVNNEIIVALDIGSSWVRVVICEWDENNILQIIGVGARPSTGLRKGVVVNIEATLKAIIGAIEDAEMMSDIEVHECWTGIGGNHITSLNTRGVVAVSGISGGKKRDSNEISEEDIERVIESAKAVAIPTDRQMIEVIPQNFKVDDHKGIRNPLGMIGVRLECEVHIITCSVTGAKNIYKCVNRAGFKIEEIILQTLAAGRAVMTQEELDLGAVLIDLGGGTTDVLVYIDGTPYSTYSIPAGGAQVTSDITFLKNVSIENAEKIKIEAGCCWDELLDKEDSIVVPGVGGRPPVSILRKDILEIIRPRMEELFRMVKHHIDSLNLPRVLGGGVVLTGGGAELPGVVELANKVLKLPARLGSPIAVKNLGGLVDEYRTTSYATVIGLALEGGRRAGIMNNSEDEQSKRTGESLIKKIRRWIREEFKT